MTKRYRRPIRDYYDEKLIEAKKEMRKDLRFLEEFGSEQDIREYAKNWNPNLTEQELEEIVRLFVAAQRERERRR